MRGIAFLTGVLALSGLGTVPAIAEPDEAETAVVTPQLSPVAEALKNKLSAKFKKRTQKDIDRGSLTAFYAERQYEPMWIENGHINQRAAAAIRELAKADVYGLKPEDYATPDLPTRASAGEDARAPAPENLADAELEISLATLTYIRHANEGRFDQSELSRFLDRKASPIDPVVKMTGLAKADDPAAYLVAQHPSNPQFKALVKALAEVKTEVEPSERINIPRGPALKPGMTNPQIALIRRRLGIEAGADQDLNIYDETLEKAVMAFQKENGLNADGVIGAQTRFTLNAPKRDRRAQILANMERWRFMPRDLGDTYINVNIPEFTVRVVSNGEVVHQERVIVGKPTNKTPVFSDEMETVVFNPYWNIPQSIIWNEMGGRIPAGYEGGVTDGRMWIRQPPGPSNALGKVKFLFPNKHSVYMHDTPAKSLFNKDRRAFSHGCMRVRNPERLAEVVLGFNGWSIARVRRYLATNNNQQVEMTKHIPVHVTYFTLRADENGKLQSFEDIYGHDNRIYAAIDKGVAYAKAKFPEVRKQSIEVDPYMLSENERGDRYQDWWAPSYNNQFWSNQRNGEPQRTRIYRKRRNQEAFGEFFSLF